MSKVVRLPPLSLWLGCWEPEDFSHLLPLPVLGSLRPITFLTLSPWELVCYHQVSIPTGAFSRRQNSIPTPTPPPVEGSTEATLCPGPSVFPVTGFIMPNEFPAEEDRPGHKSKEKSKKQQSKADESAEAKPMTPGSERGIEAFFRRILIILTYMHLTMPNTWITEAENEDYTGSRGCLDISILEPKEELKELGRQMTPQALFWFLSEQLSFWGTGHCFSLCLHINIF